MPVGVTLEFDKQQLAGITRDLAAIKNGASKAQATALNKSVVQGRRIVVDGLAATVTVSKTNIRKRTSIRRATISRLTAVIKILGRKIGLVNYKHRATKRSGATVQVYKAGGAVRLPHVFKASSPQGSKHLWERRRQGGGRVPRLPIDRLQGPSLMDVYQKKPSIRVAAERKIAAVMGLELVKAVDALLRKHWSRK